MNRGKPWEDPQLIVLQRGAPEESVLQACKTMQTGGPQAAAGGCGVAMIPVDEKQLTLDRCRSCMVMGNS